MVSSDFLKRVSAYPMVSSAYERATAGLSWAKDRSACARAAAGIAQGGLRRVADGAGPLMKRYEERIAGLDRLACRQVLDRLETACPTVLQPTDKVVELGRSYCSDAVKSKVELVLSPVTAVVAKVQSAKSTGLERYRQAVGSRHGQSGLRQFDQLIQLLSDCLDKCLPPGAAEEKGANESCDHEAGRDDDGDAGKAGTKEAAGEQHDPGHSLSLAIALGRKVSLRVSDRVADTAGRAATVGHRLLNRYIGRSASESVNSTSGASTAAAAALSADSSHRPHPNNGPAASDESDEADDSQLDRSDMSRD